MKFRSVLVACLWLLSSHAHAVLTIKITEGIEGALPIAIVPFEWNEPVAPRPAAVGAIIASDLRRSGQFAPLPETDLPSHPHDGPSINYRDWRLMGIEYLVVGKLKRKPAGDYVAQFQLFDVYKGIQMIGYSIDTTAERIRYTAHQISDLVYEKLTGQRGAFNTRIAYVTLTDNPGEGRLYTLQVADSDGQNAQTVLESKHPLLSPAWAPKGDRLAYVSFEKSSSGAGGGSTIYIQDLATGERRVAVSVTGMVSAPAWSPDGRLLAMTITRKGNPDIHILDLATKSLRRLTRSNAIDTEPAWSPDGKMLVFTSDRGGRPQIYQMSASGGRASRLTFEGKYNARASYSPDGTKLVFVHNAGSGFQIATLDIETGLVHVLTGGRLDESPSFAPNGSMIIYATDGSAGPELAAVSTDGRVRQRLILNQGGVRAPAWSPFR